MRKLLFCTFFCSVSLCSFGQRNQISIGIFTGVTSPFTFDAGINRDSRYEQKYQIKLTPIGLSYGVDYQGYGFVVTPSLANIGQNMNIVNSLGGTEGTRKINMQYLQVPIALKFHAIDLTFFKVSVVAGAGAGYLMNGSETITHNNAKYRFPNEVIPFLPPGYIIEYDGVIAPEINNLEIVSNNDFKKIQFFGSFGFRSDWEFSKSWQLALDIRANYGFTDSRTDSYLASARAHQNIYALEGKRRDVFASLNVGIARSILVAKKSGGSGKSKAKRSNGKKRKPRR